MSTSHASSDERDDPSFLQRLLAVRSHERVPVALAALAFFCLLAAMFLITPLRDEMGLRGGAKKLKYLWTCTLGGTLIASFAFAAIASHRPRVGFSRAMFRAVALIWIAFLPAVLWVDGEPGVWIARAFYVFHAVVNVFLVSLFWAVLADLLDSGQARRLFGLIAVGGTLGAMAGTAATGGVAPTGLGLWMILPAALLLEASVQVLAMLARHVAVHSHSRVATGASATSAALPLGGAAFDGLQLVLRSRYLQGTAVFTFLLGVVQTFLTFQQNYIVEAAITSTADRQQYFAWTQNAVQTLTLVVQLFVTGALMRRIGIGGALCVLPVIAVAGFVGLGSAHVMNAGTLGLVTVSFVLFRGLTHATLRPAREALFVPLSRNEKYKAKSFIDTFAFRGGDLASAWSFSAFTLASAAFVAVPITLVWGMLGLWLGRRQSAITQAEMQLGAQQPAPIE
jgi:AAA family ATP:ADP antiporter